MEQPPFVYDALESNEFRLLCILPGDTLRCELKHFRVDDPPPYYALSYTWGGTEIFDYIMVNDAELGVGKNLHDALHNIGTLAQEDKRYIWIDAICINQSDRQERSAQVMSMRNIFDNAEVVTAWVGVESSDSRLAMDKMVEFHRHLCDLMRSVEGEDHTIVQIIAKVTPQDPVFVGKEDSDTHKAWRAITKLLTRPWFTRAWVVQEVSGTNAHVLVCGNMCIDWSVIRTTMLIAQHLVSLGITQVDMSGAVLFSQLEVFRVNRRYKSRCLLLDLCGKLREYASTDPRDKIYAISGLASDLKEGDLVPDYSKSVKDVYMDFVSFSLLKSCPGHQLDFLGFVTRPSVKSGLFNSTDDDLPSWVPDWRLQLDIVPFNKWRKDVSKDELLGKVYSAGGDTNLEGFISMDELTVRGFIVDSVSHALQIADKDGYALARTVAQPNILQDIWKPEELNEIYMTSETMEIAYSRTICADTTKYGSSRIASRPHLVTWQAASKIANDPQNILASYLNSASIINSVHGRRFIWTEKRLMGLAPDAAMVGDKICVFFGGQVLYVLRDLSDSKFTFIGECYVHGLMDGEAFQWCEDYQERIQDFVIV